MRFNQYIKQIAVITDFKNDLEAFKVMCNEFLNDVLSQNNKEIFEEKCDKLFTKYYESSKVDYSFFYPESSKKNIYFKHEDLNKHLTDKLERLFEKQTDTFDEIYDETINKWDLRVFNHCIDYYSDLIRKRVSNKDIFDSELLKENLFDTLKRQYTMDNYVLSIIDKSIGFQAKLIKAISFENMLKQYVIPDELSFDLDIKGEIMKSYKIFEQNMLNYMSEMLFEMCNLFFKERNSLKYTLFKGKNSVFAAETLNKQFRLYILNNKGALL